jgi:hypothetical protein
MTSLPPFEVSSDGRFDLVVEMEGASDPAVRYV